MNFGEFMEICGRAILAAALTIGVLAYFAVFDSSTEEVETVDSEEIKFNLIDSLGSNRMMINCEYAERTNLTTIFYYWEGENTHGEINLTLACELEKDEEAGN